MIILNKIKLTWPIKTKYILLTEGKEVYIYRKYWFIIVKIITFSYKELSQAITYMNILNTK